MRTIFRPSTATIKKNANRSFKKAFGKKRQYNKNKGRQYKKTNMSYR